MERWVPVTLAAAFMQNLRSALQKHQAGNFRENFTAQLDGELGADVGRITRQLLALSADNTLHEFSNGLPLRALKVIRPEIRDFRDKERTPQIFAALDPSLEGTQYVRPVTPCLAVGQPVSNVACGRMLDAQQDDGVTSDRFPQTVTHRVQIQHRVSSRQYAGTPALEITNEVPHCAPCANVSAAVGQLVEAIDRQLNRTAPDKRLQLLLEEACAEAGKDSRDPVVE